MNLRLLEKTKSLILLKSKFGADWKTAGFLYDFQLRLMTEQIENFSNQSTNENEWMKQICDRVHNWTKGRVIGKYPISLQIFDLCPWWGVGSEFFRIQFCIKF